MSANKRDIAGFVKNLPRTLVLHDFLPTIVVLFYLGFCLVSPHFRSIENLVNILKQSSYLTMLATAQLIVLITRGFDLSVGTVIGMISVACSLAMASVVKGNPEAVSSAILLGWVVGLSIGVAVGAVNGFTVAYLGVSPFIATLGMMGIALGFASTISKGFPVYDVPGAFVNVFNRSSLIGIPMPVVICGLVLVVVYFFLNWTVFGRSLYILGSNQRLARVAGLRGRFYLAGAYVVCSLLVAIVALMLTARTGSGEPRLGVNLMFESLVAAILGGVSLGGGEGRILHCIIGSLFVTLLSNAMDMVRVNSNIQMMAMGAILILSIFLERLRMRLEVGR
jgi:ribose/xylose/arabinose/galactoside ABC-type transport system permease subunit